jgi:hypothetical protein
MKRGGAAAKSLRDLVDGAEFGTVLTILMYLRFAGACKTDSTRMRCRQSSPKSKR